MFFEKFILFVKLLMNRRKEMTMLLVAASKIEPGTLIAICHESDELYGIVMEKAVNCVEGRYFELVLLAKDFSSRSSEQLVGYPKSYWRTPKAYYKNTQWGTEPFHRQMVGSTIVLRWTGNSKELHFYVPVESCLIPIPK
jgi:hypothetical protein